MAGSDVPHNWGGWRRLGVCWLVLLLFMSVSTGVLEWLGEPAEPSVGQLRRTINVGAVSGQPLAPSEQTRTTIASVRTVAPRFGAGRDTPGPIVDPACHAT